MALLVLLAAAAGAGVVAAHFLAGHYIYPFGGLPAVIIGMEIPVMVAISLKGRVSADGTLELRIPTKLSETDVDVLLVLQPVEGEVSKPAIKGWPEGYFERTFGSLRGNPIPYDPPPDFESREELR